MTNSDSIVGEIAAERQRQIEIEGWHRDHDDAEHDRGQLARAAAAYCLAEYPHYRDEYEAIWPWADEFWKPKDNRRNLVRAAALIVAEIERLDRERLTGASER